MKKTIFTWAAMLLISGAFAQQPPKPPKPPKPVKPAAAHVKALPELSNDSIPAPPPPPPPPPKPAKLIKVRAMNEDGKPHPRLKNPEMGKGVKFTPPKIVKDTAQ